jgi:acetoin:2,6-dichlorophenolindophenol oxidoreductase subunit beta
MVGQAVIAAETLERQGVSAEVIDLRSLSPWDRECVLTSVRKTGRLVVADAAWKTCGAAAEIIATVAEVAITSLKAAPSRVCLPDIPAPTSSSLEAVYYVRAPQIAETVMRQFETHGDDPATMFSTATTP